MPTADWIDPGPKYVRVGETNRIGCDATGWLTDGKTISSVACSDADGLTVASTAVNAATFTNDIQGTCAIGKGFTSLVSGQAAGSTYELRYAMTLSTGEVKVALLTLVGVA
jgi:hypothetical protein